MAKSRSATWKKGRGKLGALGPLLGTWSATAQTPMGKLKCNRQFALAAGGAYITLDARWEIPRKPYIEHAIFGIDSDGQLTFWSFTSDGKRSVGKRVDGSDVHPSALAFEAKMPAGVARMVYWPAEDGGVHWAVESKTKKGWRRFTEHHYRPAKR
jgi:hypothetical protein